VVDNVFRFLGRQCQLPFAQRVERCLSCWF
jgi:hypothetical protein